jgi:hypothetical protein
MKQPCESLAPSGQPDPTTHFFAHAVQHNFSHPKLEHVVMKLPQIPPSDRLHPTEPQLHRWACEGQSAPELGSAQ